MVSGLAHGFLKTDVGYSSIDYPGAYDTYAYGINNAGQIVGRYRHRSSVGHGFLKTDDPAIAPLIYPGAFIRYLDPYGINDAGQIVGFFDTPLPPPPPAPLPGSVLLLGSGLLGLMGWRRFR